MAGGATPAADQALPPALVHPRVLNAFRLAAPPLRRFHSHRVEGLAHVPAQGAVLVVVHHTFATYDGFLLAHAIYERTGRVGVGLGDNLIFKVPGLRQLGWHAGIRPANPHNGRRLLAEGHLMYVAPGGMREGLRPSTQARTHVWAKRRGFVRLALEAQVPLVLAACPAADDLYTVYETPLTKLAYKQRKLPLAVVRGRGPTVLPRKVALTHFVAPPIVPPPLDPDRKAEQIEALHAEACAVMDGLLARR